MKRMQRVKPSEYERTILKPLKEAIEKAGGVAAVAKKSGMLISGLSHMLNDDRVMKIPTLMKLCSALNITLVFVNTNIDWTPKIYNGENNETT